MKLLPAQFETAALLELGYEARALLMQRDFSALANRFGYALAYGRPIAAALEADCINPVTSALPSASNDNQPVSVTYFAPNETGLFALVECIVPTSNDKSLLLELIVAGKGEEKHISIEDISGLSR